MTAHSIRQFVATYRRWLLVGSVIIVTAATVFPAFLPFSGEPVLLWLGPVWVALALAGLSGVLVSVVAILRASLASSDRAASSPSTATSQNGEWPRSADVVSYTAEDSMTGSINAQLPDQYRIEDITLIMLGLLSMSYGSLLLYNTGSFNVTVQSTITTFGYTPPVSAMIACLLLYLFGFVCLIGVGTDFAPRLTAVSWLTGLLYAGVGAIFYSNIYDGLRVRERAMGGKTDAFVLQTEGASRFLQGKNPYTYNYENEILSQVPGYFRTPLSPTYTVEQLSEAVNIVTTFDYPPVAFLWYLPSEFLGVEGVVQDVAVMILIISVLLIILPKQLRLVVPIFFMLNWNLILFPASFIPDAAWVFFVVAAIFTVRYPKTNAVVWALAASYRPQPILIASFFAIYVYKEFGGTYLKQWIPTGLLATAAINIPFALWTGPSTYWNYVTLPIRITIPPGGVGPAMVFSSTLIDESVAMQYHSAFTALVFTVWILALVAMFVYYDRLGAGAFALPGLVLLFHWRSFENYLIWFPLFVFTAYTVSFPHRDPMRLLVLRTQMIIDELKRRLHGFLPQDDSTPASTQEGD